MLEWFSRYEGELREGIGKEEHWTATEIVSLQSMWQMSLTVFHQAGPLHAAPGFKYFVSLGCLFFM